MLVEMDLKELFTKENVGGLDLSLRALIGTLALIVLAMKLVEGSIQWILALVAFVGIWTSLTRHCTPYVLLRINTAKK